MEEIIIKDKKEIINQNYDLNIFNNSNIETCTCGNKIWMQGYILKKISSLISQTGREETLTIPIFICSKCGEVAPMIKNDEKFIKIIKD